jgi:hypothetical protein
MPGVTLRVTIIDPDGLFLVRGHFRVEVASTSVILMPLAVFIRIIFGN